MYMSIVSIVLIIAEFFKQCMIDCTVSFRNPKKTVIQQEIL